MQMYVLGVDGLSRKIQEVKDFVDERVDALSRKQDSLGASQDEMKGQLSDVHDGVESVRHHPCCCMITDACARPAPALLRYCDTHTQAARS